MIRSGCVSRDTVPLARNACAILRGFVSILAFAATASAEPRELRASVVWTRADIIYLAAPDSGELVAGMTLAIVRGKRDVASAAITQLLEPRLAVARLRSGSLARERRLDKFLWMLSSSHLHLPAPDPVGDVESPRSTFQPDEYRRIKGSAARCSSFR